MADSSARFSVQGGLPSHVHPNGLVPPRCLWLRHGNGSGHCTCSPTNSETVAGNQFALAHDFNFISSRYIGIVTYNTNLETKS